MEISKNSSPRKEIIMIEVEGNKVRIKGANVVPALKNFSGDKFGPAGMRDFVIALDDEQAEVLSQFGYHIFMFHTQDDEGNEIDIPELKIRCRFDKYPPEVYTVYGDVNGVITQMTEETVGELDNIRFLDCHIAFTPYRWERGGKSGTAAYLKTMYVIIPKKDFADMFPGM